MAESSPPQRLRALGGLERWFWHMDRHRPNHFVIAAQIQGAATPDEWRAALDAVARRHPLLRVVVRETDGELAFWEDTQATIPLEIRDDPDAWKEAMERELSRPMETAPMRLTLLQGKDRCALVLALSHVVSDGTAALFVLRDLLAAATGKPLPPLPVPESQGAFLDRLGVPIPAGGPPPAPVPMPYRVDDGALPVIHARRLDSEASGAIFDRSRDEGTTVHAALAAAAVLAAPRTETPFRVFSPVRLRALLGVADDCGVFLGPGLAAVRPAPGESLWSLARRIREGLLPFQSKEVAVPALALFQALAETGANAHAGSAAYLGYELMLTNLQRLPFGTDFGRLALKSVWGPSIFVGWEGEQTVGVVTVDGALHLTHASFTPIKGFLDDLCDRLLVASVGDESAP